jgi:hypothetical protein
LFASYAFSLQKYSELEGRIIGPCVDSGTTRACGPDELHRLSDLLHAQSSVIDLKWLLAAIPLVGVGVSVFVWLSIEAARLSHSKLRRQWRQHRKGAGGLPELPMLAGGGSQRALAFGYYAPRLIPWVFITGWMFLVLIRIDVRLAYGEVFAVLISWLLYVISTVREVVKVVDAQSEDELQDSES